MAFSCLGLNELILWRNTYLYCEHYAHKWNRMALFHIALAVHIAPALAYYDNNEIAMWHWLHYSDVIIGAMASQITSLTFVCSSLYSGADQRKYQSSVSQDFVQGIAQMTGELPTKRPVTWKMFPFDDVIMVSLSFFSSWPRPSRSLEGHADINQFDFVNETSLDPPGSTVPGSEYFIHATQLWIANGSSLTRLFNNRTRVVLLWIFQTWTTTNSLKTTHFRLQNFPEINELTSI